MDKTVRRKDKDLLNAAQNIFGKIVKTAYVTTWDINSTKKVIADRLQSAKHQGDKIDDYDCIWIEFENGRMVEFTNSEWGSISVADVDNSYEL